MQLSNFPDVKEIMQLYLQAAQKELRLLLKEKINKELPNAVLPRPSRGRLEDSHDRRDYFWIRVCIEEKEYWLTLFFNEIDTNTGNYHTQIGRIQFWKNINNRTPNIQKKVNGQKIWIFQPDNSGQPEKNGKLLTNGKYQQLPTYIGEDDYDPEKVVNDFIEFIKKDIKEQSK